MQTENWDCSCADLQVFQMSLLRAVWCGSLEQEVHSGTSWASLSHPMTCQAGTAKPGRGRLCGLSLVAATVGTGSRGSCWGLAALESQAGCLSCCWDRRGASSVWAAAKSHLLHCQTCSCTCPGLSQRQFSRAPAEQATGSWILCLPSSLLSWIMGYFGVPGAGPDLTACASGRIFSALSLPLPQGNHLCGTYLAPCSQPSLRWKGCSRRLVALLAGESSPSVNS